MVLTTLVAAVALGIAAQILAERFQVPAILPLLVLGILCGPAGLALFAPEALGPELLTALVHLGVAIILFEGGLTLDPRRLLEVGGPVRNLLTIGVVVTGVGAALAAHLVLGMPWPMASLFGAIMTVTGPTVIVPLLRHLIAPREVKTVLLSEGLLIDPVGAVLAYLVLQWTERAGIPLRELLTELTVITLTGIILGFAAGAVAKLVVRTRLVSGELRNLTILALLMVCYELAEHQAPQAGILAAMVMGFTMSAAELPDLVSVKAFKGQLTTLVISMLFILLAGALDLGAMLDLGWKGPAVIVLLIVIVRPVSVIASVWPSQLAWKERLVVGLTAPRGIVAAAVASLAAQHMVALGVEGAQALEGLVYLGILMTVTWSTVMAIALPQVLGYASDPARLRAVLVGANPLTELLAQGLKKCGRTVVAIDGVSWRLDPMRASGISTVCGDARDSTTYEEAGVERDSLVIAATTNDELNLLVADLVHSEFGVEHPVVALQTPPEDVGRRSRGWIDLFGGQGTDVARWIRRLERESAVTVEVEMDGDETVHKVRELLREFDQHILPLVVWNECEPNFRFSLDNPEPGSNLVLLVEKGPALERLEGMINRAEKADPDLTEDERATLNVQRSTSK
ncbi:MAG: cation:proton antiporter [Acidobacteriota bacterium]